MNLETKQKFRHFEITKFKDYFGFGNKTKNLDILK